MLNDSIYTVPDKRSIFQGYIIIFSKCCLFNSKYLFLLAIFTRLQVVTGNIYIELSSVVISNLYRTIKCSY